MEEKSIGLVDAHDGVDICSFQVQGQLYACSGSSEALVMDICIER